MTADFKQGANLLGKILASSQVAAATTDTTVYTVPAASAVKVATATISNITGSSVTVSVSVVPSGGSVDGTHKIVPDFSLAANDATNLPEIAGAMLDAGSFISIRASAVTAINYLFTGSVSS
jgi:hypothetical protein